MNESKNLTLRIKLNDKKINFIKLEGDSESILNEFRKLVNKNERKIESVDFTTKENEPNSKNLEQELDNTDYRVEEEYIDLNTVVSYRLPGPEIEWILIYGYYASENGKKPFNRKDIIMKYKETDRFTQTNNHNLTNNIKKLLENQWIHRVDNTNGSFSLEESGKNKIKEILSRVRPGRKRSPRHNYKKINMEKLTQ